MDSGDESLMSFNDSLKSLMFLFPLITSSVLEQSLFHLEISILRIIGIQQENVLPHQATSWSLTSPGS